MSLEFHKPKRIVGVAFAAAMALALSSCDSAQPSTKSADPTVDVTSSPEPDVAVSEKMRWTWETQDLEGWTLSALPIDVTWPPGGGVSLMAPLQPEYPDVLMRSPPLSFSGKDYPRIVVDLETIVPGVQPDLSIYYKTENHGETIDFRGVADNGSLPQAGERRLLVYDMSGRAAIANDWNESTIEGIRFDLPQGAGSKHIVHSIRICRADETDCS